MLYIVYALDKQNALRRRNELFGAHYDHMERADSFGVTVTLSGPMVADDGLSGIGTVYILEAQNRTVADAFARADPFYTEGVWDTVTVNPFLKRRG